MTNLANRVRLLTDALLPFARGEANSVRRGVFTNFRRVKLKAI